jgi:hypothetical protein
MNSLTPAAVLAAIISGLFSLETAIVVAALSNKKPRKRK